jgi:ABC-2 type transport system permease protein
MMDLLVWGFVTAYLLRLHPTTPGAITFLLGAMIFWDVLYRAQQSVALSFLEDVWSRNVLNLFCAPLHLREFVAATCLVGILKITVIVLVLGLIAALAYNFHLLALGWSLLPLFANLLLMGWAIGMFTTGLIVRFGQSAENLAWAVPFMLQPVAAVFYPLSILPSWLQPVALTLPATHVFEGMRAVLQNQPFPTHSFLYALGLNGLWLLLCAAFFGRMIASARERGDLAKFGSQ